MSEQLFKENNPSAKASEPDAGIAFKLKGRLYTLMVMQLIEPRLASFTAQLEQAIQQAPRLFQGLPVVLDCTGLTERSVDLQEICHCLRAHGVFPVAVQGTTASLSTVAQCQGLAVMNGSASQDKLITVEALELPPIKEKIAESKPAPKLARTRTKYHAGTVRSGQQVVAREGDLLIMGPVSPGAEVLAEGNIYVYGALRGRALAGISGDKTARIVCQSLEAELLAIGGVYRLNEDMEQIRQPCHTYLKEDKIITDFIGYG